MIDSSSDVGNVFVVDDDQKMLESMAWTLRSVGYDVTLCSDGPGCLDAFDSKHPLCVVVDLLLPGMTGLKLCEKLATHSNCTFVMISGHGDVRSAVDAMKLGAIDFLEKPFNRDTLLTAVESGLETAKTQSEQMAEEEAVVSKMASLTSREREVFECMADGLVTKQIAAQLRSSPKTVDVHRSRISKKLGLVSPKQIAYVIYLSRRASARAKEC